MNEVARTPDSQDQSKDNSRITRLLCPFLNDAQIRAVDEYRRAYEKEWGETDLNLRYTSLLPEEDRMWLFEHETRRYFLGLPKFYQAYIHAYMQGLAQAGKLDDAPAPFINLYTRGEMTNHRFRKHR